VTGMKGRPTWWTSRVEERDVLLSLAATPGPLPAAVATRLAEGRDPASLLRAHSPEPGAVAARLDALGLRLMVPGDEGWPLDATPPDPPCAWLLVVGPAPPRAMASVAVVGGRRASPLRRAAARSIGAGLARAGWCVVSGGAVGIDAAAHAGAVDAGGRTVVVLGCGLDVPYPRANTGLFARVLADGGTLTSEHPPGAQPRAANFLPRNRLIAASLGESRMCGTFPQLEQSSFVCDRCSAREASSVCPRGDGRTLGCSARVLDDSPAHACARIATKPGE
jgi:DNA protecting protein DprA